MDGYEEFRDFVAGRGAALSRSAYLLTGDHHLAEDLLQTALSRCAAHWRRVASGNPEAYVRRCIINERTSWWRRRRYAVEVPLPETGDWDGPATAGDEMEAVVRRRMVLAALARLAPRQRAVIVLRFFEDVSEAGTAEALGCSVGTVKSQTHAALANLRSLAPELLSETESRREVQP